MAQAVVSANIFEKCLPALGTDIVRCGTVTACDVEIATESELKDIFMDSETNTKYRYMKAQLEADFEIKACETIQNGLYDFIMANKRDYSKRLKPIPIDDARYEVMPWVQAEQQSRINNEYWSVSGGTAGADPSEWRVDVESQTNIPTDLRWFNTRMVVFIDGKTAGGTATRTAWKVDSVTIVAGKARLQLTSQNDNSCLAGSSSASSNNKLEWPVTGVLTRGLPNVNSYESWCEEGPGLNTNKLVKFWIGSARYTMCKSSAYDRYMSLLIDNPYFKKFADVPEIKKNKQLANDWMKRVVNAFFWNKKLANQTGELWQSLEQINVPTSSLDIATEGECIGYRAEPEGVYEQLACCGQVKDLQGQVLNLQEFFQALYQIQRMRQSLGEVSDQIDVFTDSFYASLIQQAMVRYFKMKSEDTLRLNVDITAAPTKGKFGFRFNSYPLDWPALTLNVVSHPYFDDRVTAAKAVNQESAGRQLWVLDWAGIYLGMLGSNRVVNTQDGNVQNLAKVNDSYLCRMKAPTKQVTLNEMIWTVVVECPQSSLVIENLASDIPEHEGQSGTLDYYGAYA